jgi:hypothetical protein
MTTTRTRQRTTVSFPRVQARRRRKPISATQALRMYSRFTRRRFLAQSAASGLILGLPSNSDSAQPETAKRRPLFFNLANLVSTSGERSRRRHRPFFHIGGHTYELSSVEDNPEVLERARQRNSFLRAVPDSQITHYLRNSNLSGDITPLGYVGEPIDLQAGTWAMSMVLQFLPASALPAAYASARKLTPNGPLPLSAKRDFYGIASAFSEQDLEEELELVDPTDFARTLIALQPDILCANPVGAQIIATDYVASKSVTGFLSQVLREAGPAMPQMIPNQPNAQGWATLVPLIQDDGTPFKMADELNHLNQYFPDWNSDVDGQVATAIDAVHRKVKNDPALGADITSLVPNAKPGPLDLSIEQQLTGKVWFRHDGLTAVEHDSGSAASGPAWAYRHISGQTGLVVSQPVVSSGPDGRVQVTLNNVANWFLRYLGMYVQFVDRNGDVIPKEELPGDTIPDRDAHFPVDRENALFGGIIPPVYSSAGIPVYPPGGLSVVVNVPDRAATMNVFYAGAGGSGSAIGPAKITDVGLGLTIAINYGLVAFFMAAGVSNLGADIKALAPLAQAIAFEVATLFHGSLNSPVPTVNNALGIMRGLLQATVQKPGLTTLFGFIAARLAAATILNSIPVAGQIARAAAGVVGALQLAVTSIEIGISPPVYQFDLTFTHDLSVNLLPDNQNSSFPQPPDGYLLYYKVNYLFDNGSPHYIDAVDVKDPSVKPIEVKLTGIPWGGQVNVSVGFYMRKESTPVSENDWCAGHGTTGLVSNMVDRAPDIVIQQIVIPIQKETVYIHTRKITLDAAGRHVWTATNVAPPYVPPSAGQRPGDLAALRAITVRQATAVQAGYIGYSWQSYSSGVLDCQAGARGQLDQAANLNTDMGNRGANAQNGYATISCGLRAGGTSGVKLAYNLLTNSGANFYLDTSSSFLREIQLDPVPEFASPLEDRSFGKLNLASTELLLHPAGYVVSLNNANHKLEALKLPSAAMEDTVAENRFLARTYAGQGSRPGLLTLPMAACISAEGVILVLESSAANNRIQALDLGGNPVPYFSKQTSPYFLQLPVTKGATYLDLAIEFSGYLYVLSRNLNSPDFRMDIYHPAQSDTQPICTTKGINAAKLCVDLWRNVYVLNYEVLKLPNGQIPARTEPSVSFWVPPPPVL